MQFDTNWTTWPSAMQVIAVGLVVFVAAWLAERMLPKSTSLKIQWVVEYLFAVIAILAGIGMLLSTAMKLVQQPSWGEAVWLVVWIVIGPAFVQAGRIRWKKANALRLAPKQFHA